MNKDGKNDLAGVGGEMREKLTKFQNELVSETLCKMALDELIERLEHLKEAFKKVQDAALNLSLSKEQKKWLGRTHIFQLPIHQ